MPIFKASSSPASRSDRKKSRKNLRMHRQRQEHYEVKRNTSFTMDEVDEFKQAFDFFDSTRSKTIDFKDLERALRSLGYFLTNQETEKLISLLTVDNDTTLDFSEFCMVIECVKRERGEFGDLRDCFRVLDHKKDGYVEAEDLTHLITTKGDKELTETEASELLNFADKEKTGRIKYEGFIDELIKLENETTSSTLKEADDEMPESSKSDRKNSHYLQDDFHVAIEETRTKKEVSGNPPSIEVVDRIDKALGGPILLASAIIIKFGQISNKPTNRNVST